MGDPGGGGGAETESRKQHCEDSGNAIFLDTGGGSSVSFDLILYIFVHLLLAHNP